MKRHTPYRSTPMKRLETLSSHLPGTLGGHPLAKRMVVTREVSDALRDGRPVVALESTIISHGMPYPQNVKTARAVEEVVRTHGAVPATIAVLSGIIRIGLEPDDLELLGKTGPAVMKCSRRDLAHVVAQGGHGATTVSGTMYLASAAGIQVFVTGGVGGVHRGAQHSMDVSTDLTELGRTPVAVVCAGVKSILDIPLTLEYLETQGVPVMTIDATEFPAFFTRKSGCLSHLTGTVHDAAKLVFHQEVLGLQTGIVIANPITPSAEAEAGVINEATTRALAMANEQHVLGKDITPFLLDKINVLSAGKSLTANIALVLNNAKVGAQLANRLAALRKAECVA
ncbi:Pseudouridine-5prime-phosphate glycosidase [Diplonema papillatum]|nr:Pseudouridine-5prime-phosphate glycosidase [Diplonema papillatum]